MLSLQHLSIIFDGNNVVDDVSFVVAPKKITALVGESGSGKSLTALSILQLIPENGQIKGQIHLQQQSNVSTDLLSLPKSEIKKIRGNAISMIFQEPMSSLNPRMCIGKQVSEILLLHKNLTNKQAKEQTISLFQKVELPDPTYIYNRFPHQLSGGQKQRVMIAMAIACKPDFLIADEPTTALDVRVQKGILDLLKQYQQESELGILLITHDLGIVSEYADEVVVMYKGKIVESGNTKNILQNPTHEYTKSLLKARIPPDLKTQFPIKEGNTPVLAISNLSFSYPNKKYFFKNPKQKNPILQNIDLMIYKGEMMGIVGESGSGKTTLGRCILGLNSGYTGEILYEGKRILKQKNCEQIQVVFQDPYGSLNPRMTIGEAIMEPLQIHKILKKQNAQKERVIQLLESVHLKADHFSRFPHQFSGGQRQRICIARALSVDPQLMIFDESVSALDMHLQNQILGLILELKSKKDFTCLFISHDLRMVSAICDRVAVMQEGKIIEVGDAHQILNNPTHDYTQSLVNAIPGRSFFNN